MIRKDALIEFNLFCAEWYYFTAQSIYSSPFQ